MVLLIYLLCVTYTIMRIKSSLTIISFVVIAFTHGAFENSEVTQPLSESSYRKHKGAVINCQKYASASVALLDHTCRLTEGGLEIYIKSVVAYNNGQNFPSDIFHDVDTEALRGALSSKNTDKGSVHPFSQAYSFYEVFKLNNPQIFANSPFMPILLCQNKETIGLVPKTRLFFPSYLYAIWRGGTKTDRNHLVAMFYNKNWGISNSGLIAESVNGKIQFGPLPMRRILGTNAQIIHFQKDGTMESSTSVYMDETTINTLFKMVNCGSFEEFKNLGIKINKVFCDKSNEQRNALPEEPQEIAINMTPEALGRNVFDFGNFFTNLCNKRWRVGSASKALRS